MKASIQGKDNAIKKLRMQISQLNETRSETDRTLDFRALDFQITQLTDKVTVLQEQNELFRTENAKIKQHYKELYDSIKITRAKHIEQTTALLTENENLKAQIHENLKCITMDSVKPRVLATGRYAIDVEPIPPRNRNNREVHLDYLKHLKESVETLREIVEEAKVERPLDSSLVFAYLYTKHSHKLLEYVIGTCPKDFNQRDKNHAATPLTRKKQVTFEDQCETSNSNTHKRVEQLYIQKTNVPVPPSTGVNSCTDASGSQPRSNTKKNRILPAKSVNKKQVEEHPRTNKSSLKTTNRVDSSISSKRTVVQIILWYFDSSCSKHMTGDCSRLRNFMKKFIETVRFRNDHFGTIMGYGDYVISDSVISRHSCYVRHTDGVELNKGSRGYNLYTISVEDMMKSSPICLFSKASKNKSWLWHRRLNHLNFDTINDLQNGIVKRRNCTLVEAARTMLIFSKASMFLWAEAVATACYTQTQFLIHTRHNKTSYELVHDKKHDLTFLRVFGALCYPINDSEDLGKLQPTADIGIFVGYSPSRKGSRIYNKRTRRIMKTIHIQFDELSEPMAHVRLNIGPAPMFLMPRQIKPSRVERPVSLAPAVLVLVNSAGIPSSTTIDQDAPSPSHSPSSLALQSPSFKPALFAHFFGEENHTQIEDVSYLDQTQFKEFLASKGVNATDLLNQGWQQDFKDFMHCEPSAYRRQVSRCQSQDIQINLVQAMDDSLIVSKSSLIEPENNNAFSKSEIETQMQRQEEKVDINVEAVDARVSCHRIMGKKPDRKKLQDTSSIQALYHNNCGCNNGPVSDEEAIS
ncbi:integrase, catalytic region, zinc finger, CCHC-type containing protein [Tanacetum coccineum]